MMNKFPVFILILCCASLFIAGCETIQNILTDAGDEPMTDKPLIDPSEFDQEYPGPVNPADFVAGVDHPYWPLTPGVTLIYEGESEDGPERIVVEVLEETKMILGVACTIVRDRVFLEGELIEDTFDWYAQDKEGNVWYFGEDVQNFENGVFVDSDGAWESGVDGATPGIIMKADPEAGDQYRQEFWAGEAEDMAEFLSHNESVTVPAGTFDNCWKIMEWTPLEPDIVAHKFYAPGIGSVLEVHVEGEHERRTG
jgi:hypothetical protein